MKTPYRYSVSKQAGKWYGLDGNSVAEFTEPYYFYGYVANWGELTIEDMRNWRMSGFFRGRSSSFQLVKGLATIARHVEYTYGVQGAKNINTEPARFYIDALNPDTQEYEAYFNSEFDFTTAQDERDQYTVETMQGGIEELIKNNEDIEYTIPITGANVKTITVSPFKVRGRAYFNSVIPVEEAPSSPNRSTGDITLLNYSYFKEDDVIKILASVNYRPIDYFSVIGSFPNTIVAGTANIEFGQPAQERTAGAPDNFDTVGILKVVRSASERVDYLLKTNVAITGVTVKGLTNVFFNNTTGGSSSFRMHIYKTDYATGTTTSIYTGETKTIGAGANNTFTYAIDASFDLEAGMVLYLVLRRTVGSDVYWMQQGGEPLTINYQYYTSEFTVKGLPLYEVGTQLIDKVTNGAATFQSTLLTEAITYAEGIDCRPESVVLLSGDSIIGITDPTLKITLKDYLKAIDCWFCAGLGVEDDKVLIEKRTHFFKRQVSGSSNIIAHFDKLANWLIEDAADIRFNELHIGYKDNQNEIGDLNGRDEFNTTLKFTSSLTKNKNVLDLVNPVSASGFQIYLTYINYVTDESRNKDYKSNSELFALQYKYNPATLSVGTALYPLDIRLSGTVTGVTDTNRILNIGLSPKRCLMRHAYWLLSHFYTSLNSTFGGGAATEYILTYQSTGKNPNLASQLANNIYIAETTDVTLDALVTQLGQSRLFYPKYITIDVDSPRNYKQAWEAKRNGVFTADVEGVTITGYPLKSTDRSEKPKTTQYKMILADNNTLTDLIR